MLVFAFLASVITVTAAISNFSCPPQQVLAFVKQQELEIDLSPVIVTLCEEKRTCIYSKGLACMNKGQYVSSVYETIDGTINVGCCQYSPPVQEHQGDDCQEVVLEQSDKGGMKVSRPGTPSKENKPSPRGNPRQGTSSGSQATFRTQASSGTQANDATMELTPGTYSNPSMLVKSIKKIKSNGAGGYAVRVCAPQCGRSTTTTRRQSTSTVRPSTQRHEVPEQKQEQHGGHAKKGLHGGVHCFSGDMLVTTPSGPKRMDEVRAGDEVLVMYSDSKPLYEPIEWLYHRDHTAEADFVTITTRSGQMLRLSANHLIPIVPCSSQLTPADILTQLTNTHSYFARRLKVGSCIATLNHGNFTADPVMKVIRERKRGIYSPVTNFGTIIVNDVYVSCYSSVENHQIQKSIHTILINGRRMVSGLWKSVFGLDLTTEDSDVPMALKILLKISQAIMPCRLSLSATMCSMTYFECGYI